MTAQDAEAQYRSARQEDLDLYRIRLGCKEILGEYPPVSCGSVASVQDWLRCRPAPIPVDLLH